MKFVAAILFLLISVIGSGQTVRVGAKHFTEGYILSEMVAQLLEDNGIQVERIYNLGGTMVCYEALRNNLIDIYPEYTGTIASEILKDAGRLTQADIIEKLKSSNLSIGNSLGFENKYGLVVTAEKSAALHLTSITDLAGLELKVGVSYEFMKRKDGWDALTWAYDLLLPVDGLEHGLAYDALITNKIDLTDCYTTDGEIATNNLVVLKDNRNFFPEYHAVSLYRTELPPNVIGAITKLEGKITENEMSTMNAKAVSGIPYEDVAREFLIHKKLISGKVSAGQPTLLSRLAKHLFLTFTALMIAMVVALPLAVWLYWTPKLSNTVLYVAGLLQTIPSIALLAVMIPLFGIGALPAIVALFLYALLPILRNTVTGLRNVDPLLKEAATGLGMTRTQALRYVEWPLALPSILAGIRIAAVINVGTATLAAFIGAGGLGEYIVTGLALNDTGMILMGALPAAGLALVLELVFEVVERRSNT